ncbi:MAG: HlyD family type I secretion periplasmic adaptor subunit [Proteobacteria bacterium]|nr:HlyD family type I secretion periplasmic adaptor subunit [Pseudomonadota bacterium]
MTDSKDIAPFNDMYALDDTANPKRWRGVVVLGFVIIFVFFGIFGVWASLAQLGSGAIAVGQLQVDSNQKTVQHLEGGLIRRIHVRNGDMVPAGKVLVELDDTRNRMEFDVLEQQHMANLGARARLIAERDHEPSVTFPAALTARKADPYVAEIIDGQQRLFNNRLRARESQISLLEKRVGKTREEIAALGAQQQADERQLELISEEIDDVRKLYEAGLARKTRFLSLERSEAQLQGSIGNREALAARAEQTIAETEFQKVNLIEQSASEVEAELRLVQDLLEDLQDRIAGARDSLDRTQIRAPYAGRVYGLRFHTEGGVVGPAEPMMGIVPENDELIVQVRIDPVDRDVVETGAPANVRLTSFSQRTTKPIEGKLVEISADIVQADGQAPYYEARIELDRESLAQQPDLNLIQGMPATAVISTGDQTLLEYILAPISRSLEQALKEN